jgi:hypothetical protein
VLSIDYNTNSNTSQWHVAINDPHLQQLDFSFWCLWPQVFVEFLAATWLHPRAS